MIRTEKGLERLKSVPFLSSLANPKPTIYPTGSLRLNLNQEQSNALSCSEAMLANKYPGVMASDHRRRSWKIETGAGLGADESVRKHHDTESLRQIQP